MEHADLLIIGAGQSGLAVAHGARIAGLAPILLEASDRPAGSWPRYYDSLTLFSPARYSALPGQPMPGAPDRYPTRDELAAYLADYARQFGDAVRLGERVDRVDPLPGGGFVVTTASGGEWNASAVIAATGTFDSPHRPALPGLDGFEGAVLHASEYVAPGAFAGQRVVVVGAGNSAIQIAAELAAGARTTLATREPIKWFSQVILRRDLHWWLRRTGFDVAPLLRWLPNLPVSVIDAGTYRAALAAGRPDRRPMFDRLDRRDVVWSDGRREQLDALILATGYRPHLPYLTHTGALDAGGVPLHKRGLSTTVRGLGYVGLEFQHSFSSNTVRGCARDARHVVEQLKRSATSGADRMLATR